MKKSVVFFAALALIASLSSCKKSFTCTCIYGTYSEFFDVTTYDQEVYKKEMSGKDALEWCDGLELSKDSTTVSCDLQKN
ncbi:MAG: hypothetical protein ACOVOO_05825 [Flavobacteriales bacterium]|jgi:hypothetical protein